MEKTIFNDNNVEEPKINNDNDLSNNNSSVNINVSDENNEEEEEDWNNIQKREVGEEPNEEINGFSSYFEQFDKKFN